MTLLRVVAPHFVAGIVTDGESVREAAPIMAYMLGWDATRFRAYVRQKSWKVERCDVEPDEDSV